jgi:hypothetical protein
MASISSMNTMEGDRSSATLKSSRTGRLEENDEKTKNAGGMYEKG